MNKENIMTQARNNSMKMNHIKLSLENAARFIFSKKDLDKGWNYDSESKTFRRFFTESEIGPTPIYRTHCIEFNYNGVTLMGNYDHWEGKMDYLMIVPEDCTDSKVQLLLELLKSRRRTLYNQFKVLCESVADSYFNEHKEKLISEVGISELKTPSFIVWDCGDTKNKSDEKMRNAFKRKITHNNSEDLDSFEEFIPTLFHNNRMLETTLRCGKYEFTFTRNYIVDESITHYPEIIVSFQMKASADPMFKCALDVLFWKEKAEEKKQLLNFRAAVESAEWFLEDEVATCYVPIIYEQFAQYICNNASKVLDNVKTEIVVKYIPLHDQEMTCIRCTVS